MTRVRLRWTPGCWQASVNGAAWYELPTTRVAPHASIEFVLGYFLGRVPAFTADDIEFVLYLDTWAEETVTREAHEGARQYTPPGASF